MIKLKSIEIFNIQNREEKQILLKWNMENGVQRYHSVTIQSPLAVDDVIKALRDLQDILRNDPLLVAEDKKEEWKKQYLSALQIKYGHSKEEAMTFYLAGINDHDYLLNPEDAAEDDMDFDYDLAN